MPSTHTRDARTQAIRSLLREHARTVWSVRLDERMDALNVTIPVLADAAGTTYQTIWKMLRGDLYPSEYLRVAIALALGTDTDRLFPLPAREALAAAADSLVAA